jgi:hypothetical protein
MRFAAAALLFVMGATTGLAAVALHEIWWGFLLAASATVVVMLAIGRGWLTRLPFALGWVALVAWVTPRRPEGDYVVSSDAPGYVLLGFGWFVLLFALLTLRHPRRGRPVEEAEPS